MAGFLEKHMVKLPSQPDGQPSSGNVNNVLQWFFFVVVVGSFPLWARYFGGSLLPTSIKEGFLISDLIAFSFLLSVTSLFDCYDKKTLFGIEVFRKVLFWVSVCSALFCSVFTVFSIIGIENTSFAFKAAIGLSLANLAIGFLVSFD